MITGFSSESVVVSAAGVRVCVLADWFMKMIFGVEICWQWLWEALNPQLLLERNKHVLLFTSKAPTMCL